jgi:ribosomal protein L31E
MADTAKTAAKKPASQAPADEMLLTIPLRREWLKAPRNRRARRSITTIRAFLSRHMKVPETDIRISARLNNTIWVGGAGKPPAKIRIKASLDASTGLLHARLPDEEAPKPEKKGKEEKPEKPGEPKKEPEKKEEASKEEEKPAEKPEESKPKEPEKKELKTETPEKGKK